MQISSEQREETRTEYLLLAPTVEIDSTDAALPLVEADVVEPLEAGAVDGAHPVVGDEEVLLPAHEDVVLVVQVLDVHGALAGMLGIGAERRELVPVVQVDLLGRAPAVVVRDEVVLGPDDLALKVCRQGRVVFCETCVACNKRPQMSVIG